MATNRTVVFLQHDVGVQIPDDLWSPVPYNVIRTIEGGYEPFVQGFRAQSTTVAAGSNGQVLPEGGAAITINVASTAGFSAAGYLCIRVGTTDRVVQYTAKNATQFLGCTFGVGTLTTGDVVRQGLVDWAPPQGTVLSTTAEWAWTSNATGVRGCRHRDRSIFQLEAGGDVRAAVATPALAPLRTWCTEAPGSPNSAGANGAPLRIELYQNSTAVGGLATAFNAASLGYPRLVATILADF